MSLTLSKVLYLVAVILFVVAALGVGAEFPLVNLGLASLAGGLLAS